MQDKTTTILEMIDDETSVTKNCPMGVSSEEQHSEKEEHIAIPSIQSQSDQTNEERINHGRCYNPKDVADSSMQKKVTKIKVALMHSSAHTTVLHRAMEFIHKDRDLLLAALLDYCGFLRKTPSFLSVISPKKASRKHLESFHSSGYLDLLEYPVPGREHEPPATMPLHLLDAHGLTDDCPLPTGKKERAALWKYILHVAGASLHAAKLLSSNEANVAIHWGGGRHHAHSSKAGGFCFVNDTVLALQHLQSIYSKLLYIDIDIHHADGVQNAFYDTDKVMTVSLHRHTPGFFPSHTGSIGEKGSFGTDGVGYNLNLPMPQGCKDVDFFNTFQYALTQLLAALSPEAVVLCVGADGLLDDPLVGNLDGWGLTPEGIADCVRFAAQACAENHKLLLLGAGGYHPARAARTFLLCTAAACDGARPGMLSNELPKDVPRHEYFPRYGPNFMLINERPFLEEGRKGGEYGRTLWEAKKAIDLATVYIRSQNEKENQGFNFDFSGSELSSNGPNRARELVPIRNGRRLRRRKGGTSIVTSDVASN